MPLIDLKTNLKSLKYGNDRRGGGSSNQPYITTPIPDDSDPLTNKLLYGTGGPDILIRGGTLTPKKIINDTIRISKFFTDTKSIKGYLFITNQNILSRLAPKTEASKGISYGGSIINQGIYSPLNTLTQLHSYLAGFRVNNRGIDPTGFSPTLSIQKYENVVRTNNNENKNRLVNLFKSGINVTNNDPVLIKYSGGPGSVLGIGNTELKRKEYTGINNPLYNLNKNYFLKGGLNNSFTNREYKFNGNSLLGASDAAFVQMDLNEPIDNGFSFPEGQQLKYYGPKDDNSTLSINDKGIDLLTYQSFQKSFRKKEEKNNIGGTNSFALHPWGVDDFNDQDIIKFYITVINNDNTADNNFYYFPAFIDSWTDSIGSNWKTEKIMGRGEEFFVYEGFTREFSLGFKVYSRDRNYLNKMYDNLNNILAALTPDYSSKGFMRGNFFKLTMGKYVEDLPGIITSLSYTVPQESPWDVNKDVQLPQFIEVSLTYKPIHNYLPNKFSRFIGKNIPTDEI